jgi:predicted lipoprotein with Yx(FWY)xxD motif
MRAVLRWAINPALYCGPECLSDWEPLLAPAGSAANIAFPVGNRADSEPRTESGRQLLDPQKAPDWTIIEGPQGPQWVYKGWHMVFVRRGSAPGSTQFDGADGRIWNTLKFVPPVPKVVAPPTIAAQFVKGAYILTDRDGRTLFTGHCTSDCDRWRPLRAPMASLAIGSWQVSQGDDGAQWTVSGQTVFASREDDPLSSAIRLIQISLLRLQTGRKRQNPQNARRASRGT